MDILLTHGYFLSEDAKERHIMKPHPPLGILYLSSHLGSRGFDVSVFDSTFATRGDFSAFLEKHRPGVVGISANLMTKPTVLSMAAECHRNGATVVLGGPDPPHYAEEYLAHGADVVVGGEGEVTLEELLPRLAARPGRRDWTDIAGLVYRDEAGAVVRTPPRALIANLNGQPFPDRAAVDMAAYLETWRTHHGYGPVSLITARGCPYTCRWCSRSVFGETHRRRSAENVADEVEQIADRFRPDALWYADDVFTIHHGFIQKLADEFTRRGIRIPFECISRPERITETVADDLVRLGCRRLWIGSESGSQRILDAMDRRITLEQVRQAVRLLKARGIEVGMFIMLGYAGEELSDIESTVDHLKRTAPDVLLTTVSYPIKGTPYYDDVADRIVPTSDWASGSDRDLEIAGRKGNGYYRFAQQWMTAEVARERHWQAGRYIHAACAAARAGVGRLGMVWIDGR